jgi:hypothetical protein
MNRASDSLRATGRRGERGEISQSGLALAFDTRVVCGVDEAGRGPLAGPVVAAAVILDPLRVIDGLRDSKKLSQARREALAIVIREGSLGWAIGQASVDEIDQLIGGPLTELLGHDGVVGLLYPPVRGPSGGGDPDNLRASISGIRTPFDVALSLECLHLTGESSGVDTSGLREIAHA